MGYKPRGIPRGTVRISSEDMPVWTIKGGIMFEETDHGWVECPPYEIWRKRVWEKAERRAKEERRIHGPKYRRPLGFRPDLDKRPVILRRCRFSSPGIDQVTAVLRERERKEEVRKRKG